MDSAVRDVLNRAERISRLEMAAGLMARPQPARRWDVRPLLAAALGLLLALYPGISAAAWMI